MQSLNSIVDLDTYPIEDPGFGEECLKNLDTDGVLTLPGFLRQDAIEQLVQEAERQKNNAYFTSSTHNVYLTPTRSDLGSDHIFNRQLCSSKGCITTDQVPKNSHLQTVYNANVFRQFIATVVGEKTLYEYADPVSYTHLTLPTKLIV